MIVQELPSEIFQKILEHLHREDLRNLLYTCKKWHPIVKSVYFEQVTWRIERIQWLKRHLAAMNEADNDTQIFQQFPMTKRLLIHSDVDRQSKGAFGLYMSPSTQFTAKEFLYLLTLFPNLKYLDITQSTHREHYLEILCNSASMDLPSLEEIVTEREYAEDEDEESRQLKFEACYRFRHSLKRMAVSYIDNFGDGKSFMESLSEFESLESLEIHNDTDPDLSLFHLLEACPNLSTLAYTSTFEAPEDATQQLEDMVQKLKDENSSISDFLKNLKKLTLSVPWLTAPYMDFFINHCPKSLNHVGIQSKQFGMHGWVLSETLDVVLDFCKSLQRLTKVTLWFDEESVIEHGEIDLFYQILDTLTGSREFKTRSVVHKDREELVSTGVAIEIAGSELYYEYCYDIEEFMSECTSEQSHSAPSALSLKQLALVNKFNIWTADYFYEYGGIPKYYLEYTKKFLPKIRLFQYQCASKKCYFEAECLSNDQSLQKMTQVSLDGFDYPQRALYDLPTYFPRTEILSFVLNFRNEQAKFELANFKHLHTLVIGVDYISDFNDNPVFLQYTDINQETTLCLLKIKTATDGDVTGIKLENISADIKQKLLKSVDTKYGYTISVKASNQLKRIEWKYYDRTYANLEL